jgi:hypothetical protein
MICKVFLCYCGLCDFIHIKEDSIIRRYRYNDYNIDVDQLLHLYCLSDVTRR